MSYRVCTRVSKGFSNALNGSTVINTLLLDNRNDPIETRFC